MVKIDDEVYYCDPSKHTECTKTGCFLNGGTCRFTLHEEYADTTIDVAPVRHGRWLRTDAYPHRIYCSECYSTFIRNDEFLHLEDIPHNYCPDCGARMMDEVEEAIKDITLEAWNLDGSPTRYIKAKMDGGQSDDSD